MALFLEEYEKLRMLGKGSFASVYKVRHHNLGYVRAIKVSNDLVAEENDHAYQTFLNECRVLLKIGNGCHPNIVRIYQPRLIANKAIVEMDYVDGEPLSAYIARNKFIEFDEFRRFALEIVGALAYCHVDLYHFLMDPEADDLQPDPADGSKFLISEQKMNELIHKYAVNHNDLHSNNIMRRHYDGSFVLLDFGLAIQDDHCVKSSSRGDGAYEYCSPEKLEQRNHITSASDVYSLGILLYEMLAGRVPFPLLTGNVPLEAARFKVYNSHLHDTPPSIEPFRRESFEATHPGQQYERDYPVTIDQIIFRCLEKNPADRYPNAKALLNDLKIAFAEADRQTSAKKSQQVTPVPGFRQTPPPAVESAMVSDLRSRLHQSEESLAKLQSAYREAQREITQLKNRTPGLPPVIPGPGDPHSPVAPRRASSSRGLWIVSLLLILISVATTAALLLSTDYFRSYDALIDKIALASGAASLIAAIATGLFRRPPMLMVGGCCMLSALTAALGLMTSFDRWNYAIAALSALSIPFMVVYWIRSERISATAAALPEEEEEEVAELA